MTYSNGLAMDSSLDHEGLICEDWTVQTQLSCHPKASTGDQEGKLQSSVGRFLLLGAIPREILRVKIFARMKTLDDSD